MHALEYESVQRGVELIVAVTSCEVVSFNGAHECCFWILDAVGVYSSRAGSLDDRICDQVPL